MYKENARRDLLKISTYFFEQIQEATPLKQQLYGYIPSKKDQQDNSWCVIKPNQNKPN